MKNVFLLLAITIFSLSCSKDDDNTIVYKVDEIVAGYSMADLQAEFNKWIFGKSIAASPLSDEDGSLHTPQPLQNIVMLSPNLGGKTTRKLTLSSDKILYIPVMGFTIWYYKNDPCDPDWIPANGQSELDFLKGESAGFLETSSDVSLTLNGVNVVDDIKKYKVVSNQVFSFSVHNDWNNPDCDYIGKSAIGYAEDYSVCLKLPKGTHTIVAKGKFEPDLDQDITWILTVN